MFKKWSEMGSFSPSDMSSDRSDDFPSVGEQLGYAWKKHKHELVDKIVNWKPIVIEDKKPVDRGPGLGRRIFSGLGHKAVATAESYFRKKMQQKNKSRHSDYPQIPFSIDKSDPETIEGEFKVK